MRVLILLLIPLLWLMAGVAQVYAQGNPIVTPPSQTTTHVDVTLQAPPPDPKAIADASVQSAQAVIVTLAAPTLATWANDLLNVPDFIRQTPPGLSYRNDAVRGLTRQVTLVAGALIALAVFVVGLAHTLGQRPSFGRLIFGALLSITDLAWWQMGIDLNNAINNGIASPALASLVKPHLSLPTLTADPVAAFGPAVLVIVYAVVALLLMLSMAFRLGLIDILICVGPLGLLCGTTEQTQAFYSRYLTLSAGTLFSQVMVVVALKLAPIIGGVGAGIAGTLLGIVVLLLARRMPSLLASGAGNAAGGGGFFRLVMLRRLLLRA